MAGTADIGTGTTLTFSGITVNLTSIAASGISRASILAAHLGTTGGQPFIPGDTYDPGQIECEFQTDCDTAATTMDVEAIMVGASGAFTIQFPANTTATASGAGFTGNAFLTDFNPFSAPFEELVTGSFTLKCSGDWSTTNGS